MLLLDKGVIVTQSRILTQIQRFQLGEERVVERDLARQCIRAEVERHQIGQEGEIERDRTHELIVAEIDGGDVK